MLELIKVRKQELANKEEKPDLGIDVHPVGLEKVQRNKVPTSIPNTFYDLFYPQVSAKGDEIKKKDIKFYTFSALLSTYLSKVLPKISDSAPLMSKDELFRYYKAGGASLANKVKVKREGVDFKIEMPLFTLKIDNIIDSIERAAELDLNEFYSSIWEKNITGLPFPMGQKVDEFIPKNNLAGQPESTFSKAGSFWNKYFKGYKITTSKPLPSKPEFDAQKQRTGRVVCDTEFNISAIVLLPYAEARYYVQSESPKEFELLDYIHSWYTIAFSSPAKNLFPTFKHSMVAIRQKNLSYDKKATTGVNEDQLALTSKNVLYYIPNVDFVDQHRNSLIEATYNEETESYSYDHNPAKLPRHQLVYTDWVNKRIAYTTENAKLNTIDLRVLYSVTATNYLTRLTEIVTEDFVNDLENLAMKARRIGIFNGDISSSNLDTLMERLSTVNTFASKYYVGKAHSEFFSVGKPLAGLHYIYQKFLDAVHTQSSKYFEYTKQGSEYFDEVLRVGKEPTKADYVGGGFFYLFTNYLRSLHDAIFSDSDTPLKLVNECNRSVPGTLKQLADVLSLSKIRSKDILWKVSKAEREAYLTQDDIDPNSPVELKNFEGVEAFMRHQATTVKKLNKAPKFAIVGVQAGGGKTLIALADISQAIEQGYVKKPLVLCPNNLIKDYVNESIFAGNGKLNVVALDGTVFANYAQKGKDEHDNTIWEYDRLEALITRAPPNTIFVIGYDVISGAHSNKVMNVYGSEVYESYTHLDFLARCGFDGVWADESHYLKGGDSLRAKVNELLINKIPYRRLLTGTIVPNVLMDLVKQVGLFDPSILGNETEFAQKYGDPEARGFVPRPEALNEIAEKLKDHCAYINVSRKEWAAFLPQLHEQEAFAELTENQKIVYGLLIGKALDELENSKEGKELEILLEDTSVDEENDEKIEKIFENAFGNLAAVEGFLSNPESVPDHLKEHLKTKEDLISPKGRAVAEIIDLHINQEPETHPGKILVFCNTHAAVAGVWNSLPPNLRAVSMRYSAAKKADHEMRFKTDDKIRVLIGVSQSLDTGLNLQAADTIIRVDTVWTPGKLEQGNARVNRPKLKGEDFRMEHGVNIYYVLVDGTIDTIKWAKLTSKTVTLAKFYSQGTQDAHRYEQLGYDADGKLIEPLKVSFKLLREGMKRHDLADYTYAYEGLRQVEHQLYDDYRDKNPEYFDKVPIKHTGILEGSKLLKNVPYVAGAGVFNADELGLEPYLVYKRKTVANDGEENWNPEGLLVHTEFGDGKVIKETASSVQVRMDSGIKKIVKPEVLFVITKKLTSTLEIKDQIAKATGLKALDIQLKTFREDKEMERLEKRQEVEREKQLKQEIREQKRREKEREAEERKQGRMTDLDPTDAVEPIEEEVDETSEVELKFTPINEMLALTIISDDPQGELPLFKSYGFKATRPYISMRIKHVQELDKVLTKLEALEDKGVIDIPYDIWEMWSNLEHEFAGGRSKLLKVHQTPQAKIKHYLRINHRKVRVPNILRPYPMIKDKRLYMVINVAVHNPSTLQKVKRIKAAGSMWEVNDEELVAIFSTKQTLHNALKKMEADGWDLVNKKEIKSQVAKTKITPVKR